MERAIEGSVLDLVESLLAERATEIQPVDAELQFDTARSRSTRRLRARALFFRRREACRRD